jgi:hypothetical protein
MSFSLSIAAVQGANDIMSKALLKALQILSRYASFSDRGLPSGISVPVSREKLLLS